MTADSGPEGLWALFGAGPRGVLVTATRSGRPQLSNVGYLYHDWAEFRVAMVHEQRLLVRLPLIHVYGWNPLRPRFRRDGYR